MKTVIILDTDDLKGIKNSKKIVDHIYNEYIVPRHLTTITLNKFKFIKIIKQFAREVKKEQQGKRPQDIESILFCKYFADEIWREIQVNKDE